ncbi:ArdC family protein [Brevundimonas sp.]|uniref:ArdC family protein n=1 Tax=Brevundimonas sp. TaxID=1871086 RepID=UPI0028A8F78D|nr:zincin-like metallopeptidase domain-containing protein [Brevundimonas sp.]
MTTSAKQDIYQTVTDSIVGMLGKGVRPWAPQWEAGSCGLPAIPTRANGESYRGINVALLWGAAEMKGYRHHTWMTFNQAKELGGCVRKGEKSTPIVYWGSYAKEDENGEEETRLFAKGYAVFNVEQIDHLPERFYEAAPVVETAERIKLADQWAVGTGADIRHGGAKAFFSPKSDHVQMPPLEAFYEREAYYATLAHELTHWSGAKARLDRQFGKRFGDKAYAFEELVAELGAAFAMARLGIAAEPREDHASYLASWLKVLKSDKRAIFTAASKAQAACDYLFDIASKAEIKPVERPSIPTGVICLPDLSGLSSEPVSAVVEDDGDDDPTPPVAPCPAPVSTGVAAGFLSRLSAFKGGRVRAPSRVAARKVRTVDDIVADITPDPVIKTSRPFHPRRDPSLCEFLSIRGICDDGGELKARDLDRWHREAPFRRKLVRPDGVSLETAARQAWEAGYFDHVPAPTMDSSDNMHPVTPEMLIAALDRELRDDYAHVWADHDEAFFA